VPMTMPVAVSRVASAPCAMPKSMTTGSPSTSMTLPGFMSRWTMPAPWIADSADASPSASRCSPAGSIGPCSSTISSSVRPGTYWVTM
jgi:hypothetical protein